METPSAPVDRVVVGGIGASVHLAVNGQRAGELAASLRTLWSRCLDPAQGVDAGRLDLHLDDALPTQPAASRTHSTLAGADLGALLTAATQAVTYALIQAQIGNLLLLHACALSNPDTGRGLVCVAAGGTGKTTLTRTFGTRYGYLTDETVAIDGDRILPYPKPLSVREPGAPTKSEHAPDALGLRAPAPGTETTVGRLVLLDRDDTHAGAPEVTELGLFDAIAGLAEQSSSLYRLPHALHACRDLIDATGPVLSVRYREAASLQPLVADLIGTPS